MGFIEFPRPLKRRTEVRIVPEFLEKMRGDSQIAARKENEDKKQRSKKNMKKCLQNEVKSGRNIKRA